MLRGEAEHAVLMMAYKISRRIGANMILLFFWIAGKEDALALSHPGRVSPHEARDDAALGGAVPRGFDDERLRFLWRGPVREVSGLYLLVVSS